MNNWQPPNERPYLYITSTEISATRTRLNTGDPQTVAACESLAATARQAAILILPDFDHRFAIPLVFEGWHSAYTDVNKQGYWLNKVTEPSLEAALHYRLTDDDASLETVRRILLHFAGGYIFDIEHYDVGLNDVIFGLPLLYAYDLTYDHYNALERVLIERFFADLAGHLLANDKYWVRNHIGGDYNNHYVWHKLGLASYGLHTGRSEYIDYCLAPPMGVFDLLQHGMRDDGLWLECSTGYHFSVALPMLLLGRSLTLAGWPLDLLNSPSARGNTWRDLFTSMLNLLLPDNILPTVGDNYGDPPTLPAEDYALAFAIWRDPRLAWATKDSPRHYKGLAAIGGLLGVDPAEVEEPQPTTRAWPEHGYAMLVERAPEGYFSPTSAACFITYGYGGIHGHRDKLTFELYAAGVRWLVDAEGRPSRERHAMTSRLNEEWNNHTLVNNGVVVDGAAQNWLKESLELREFNAVERRVVAADAGALYTGVRQVRTWQLALDALADTHELTSDTEHCYDYMLHLAPGAELEIALAMQSRVSAGDTQGYAWLREVRCVPLPTEGLTVRARLAGSELMITLQASEAAELWCAVSPRTEEWEPPHFPAVWLRTHCNNVVFKAEYRWQE
ncbi:MAG: heparinase II/III domain-containing protein [Anaerolineae bacterium]